MPPAKGAILASFLDERRALGLALRWATGFFTDVALRLVLDLGRGNHRLIPVDAVSCRPCGSIVWFALARAPAYRAWRQLSAPARPVQAPPRAPHPLA